MVAKCDGWCWPVYAYIIIAVIGVLMNVLREWSSGLVGMVWSVGFQILFAFIWTWLLYYLCKTCHQGWATIIFLAPFLLGVLFTFIIPVGFDLLSGRKLRLGRRFSDVLQTSQDVLERQMQQPDGSQPSQVIQDEINQFRYGQPVGVDDLKNIASGVLRTGGYNADPAGVRSY